MVMIAQFPQPFNSLGDRLARLFRSAPARSSRDPTPVPRDRARPLPLAHPELPLPAFLVKLHEAKPSMPALRRFLVEHPALVYLLGFPLTADASAPGGFDVEASVPTRRQFNRVLRELPNDALQFLLTSSVHLIRDAL